MCGATITTQAKRLKTCFARCGVPTTRALHTRYLSSQWPEQRQCAKLPQPFDHCHWKDQAICGRRIVERSLEMLQP